MINFDKVLNSTSWDTINDIGRNFTKNYNQSQQINWSDFDKLFEQQKLKYDNEETIKNDDYYLKFKYIAELENDYYVWKKKQIENPVIKKKIKASITNANSDSLFTDIGKNLHDSYQLISFAKIPEKYKFIKIRNVICSQSCIDNCLKNYVDLSDVSRCKVITCECYKLESLSDENETLNVLLTKDYFKESILKAVIILFVLLCCIQIFNEISQKNNEADNDNHYHRLEDDVDDSNMTDNRLDINKIDVLR